MSTHLPIEAYTTTFNYLKHLASLSTGSVLLIVALNEKLFITPEWKTAIGISLVSFVVTIVFTIASQAGVIEQIAKPEEVSKWARPLMVTSFSGAVIFFMLGLISLVGFALKNFF